MTLEDFADAVDDADDAEGVKLKAVVPAPSPFKKYLRFIPVLLCLGSCGFDCSWLCDKISRMVSASFGRAWQIDDLNLCKSVNRVL